MKNSICTISICILLATGLAGCDFSDLNQAVDDFGIVVELDSIHTTSTVLVTDAKSDELITEDVDVTFGGPTGDQVIDIYSDPLSERTVGSGILNFGISNSVDPTPNSPAEVILQLEADGYLTTNRTVTIDSEGSNEFSVEMIRESDPPDGVEMESNTDGQADQDGVVQENINVEVLSQSSSGAGSNTKAEEAPYGVELNIPAGTEFEDADGNPLTGQLTIDVTYYNPLEKEAMKAIPFDMKTEEGRRVRTFGMFSMQVTDAEGKVAAAVSSGSPDGKENDGSSVPAKGYLMNATVCVDANFNGKCGEGEAMTATKTSDDRGRFTVAPLSSKFQNAPTLVRNTGNPNAERISELPNLELKAPPQENVVTPIEALIQSKSEGVPDIIAAKQTPPSTGTIDILRNEYAGSVTTEISTAGFSVSKRIDARARAVNEALRRVRAEIQNLPREDLNYTIKAPYLNNAITGIHNFAEQGNLEVELPAPPPSIIDATIEVSLQCENPDEKVAVTDIPSASVVYRKANAESGAGWSVASGLEWEYDEESQELTGGRFDVSAVEEGADYTFKITYESTSYERDITISGESVTYTETVSGGVCN